MPNSTNREYRNMKIETRDMIEGEEERKIVTGYASTFDEPYKLFEWDGGEYWEVVDRSAFNTTDMSDVIMQYDHEGRVFARTKNNTLDITVDDHGLKIEADLGGTEIGRELFEEIRGGYTDKMSFGFTVNGESEDREKLDNGVVKYTRRITSVNKLYDVSAVSIPANDGTEIGADATARSIRSLSDGVIEKDRAERLAAEKLEIERRRTLVRVKALSGGVTK